MAAYEAKLPINLIRLCTKTLNDHVLDHYKALYKGGIEFSRRPQRSLLAPKPPTVQEPRQTVP